MPTLSLMELLLRGDCVLMPSRPAVLAGLPASGHPAGAGAFNNSGTGSSPLANTGGNVTQKEDHPSLALALPCCVSSGKFMNLSEPLLLICDIGMIIVSPSERWLQGQVS